MHILHTCKSNCISYTQVDIVRRDFYCDGVGTKSVEPLYALNTQDQGATNTIFCEIINLPINVMAHYITILATPKSDYSGTRLEFD